MAKERFPWRMYTTYGSFSTAGGGFVGFVMRRFEWDLRYILQGALIGFCCYSMAFFAELIFQKWTAAKPEQWWRRAILYFLASQLGWPVGLIIGMPLIWGVVPRFIVPNRTGLLVVAVLGGVGALAGIIAMGYERLKERLQSSIEQLKEKEFADKELQLARELQSRMLPAPEIAADGYRISGRNFAARYVAGDFYDVFNYADGAIGIAVADVAGKGMAASLIMASVKAVLPLLASTRSIDEAMAALNEKLVGELAKREFVALSLARYEPESGRMIVANAGLPDPYIVHAGGAVSTIEVPGPRLPLGLKKSIQYQKSEFVLEKGEAMMLFSDGLPEATMAGGEQIGYPGLLEMVRLSGPSVDGIMDRIHAVEQGPRDDDQTLVMIQRS